MKARIHSRELKLEVCREHELANSLLARWRKEYERRGEAAFTPGPDSKIEGPEAKVAELERFCGQLAWENTRKGDMRSVNRGSGTCSPVIGSGYEATCTYHAYASGADPPPGNISSRCC